MSNLYENLTGIENNFIELYGVKDSPEQKARYERCFYAFKNRFGVEKAYIASSGGRVEICGNHTDHNGGKAIVAAVSLDSLAFFLPVSGDDITIYSEGYGEIKVPIYKEFNGSKGTSAALVYGVLRAFTDHGYKIGGFNAYVSSNVLSGSGVSSSASFEVLICEILNFLYNDGKVSQYEKALFSQYAENVYFGKPCGLLDQTAISFGGLKMLDFKDEKKIEVTEINDDLSDYTVVLINTGGSHAGLTDEYASIPKEMKDVAKCFGKKRLIEISENKFYEGLEKGQVKASDRAINRAIHFYEENQRVENCSKALNGKNYNIFLQQIRDSGISSLCKLQNCYVAGKTEQAIPKSLFISSKFLKDGANRVHGGGFAGTILNIIKNSDLDYFLTKCSAYFGSENVFPLKIRSVGAKVL